MAGYLADLHLHPGFKPYNNLEEDPDTDIWNPIEEKGDLFAQIPNELKPIIEETARSSQSNLDNLFKGHVRGIFTVIHAMERGWLFRRKASPHPIRKLILNQVLKPEDMPVIAASLSGIPIEKIQRIFEAIKNDEKMDYYLEETFKEYSFLVDNQANIGQQNAEYRIVNNYDEYKDIIDNHPKKMAMILTIEGGHALSQLSRISLFKKHYHELSEVEQKDIRKHYLSNIKRIKGLLKTNAFGKRHTPLFITLVHMYNNFLAGHAKSYKEGTGIYPGMDDFLDQEVAMNTGISPLGYEVIGKLLNKSADERRILIDVKHMSLAARKAYYALVDGKRQNGDPIPIIYSHGGVNGFPETRFSGEDFNADDTHGYLSHWSINLYDEDIVKIVDSDGIIGLAPHEGRMPGGEALQIFSQLKQAIKWDDHRKVTYEMILKKEYIKLVLCNIFHIVSVVDNVKAWDHICIGSDYDGIMNPFDSYPKSSDLTSMMGDIKKYLDDIDEEIVHYYNGSRGTFSKNEQKKLMFGLSSRQIINKLSYQNLESFLSKYFTTGYLGGSNLV